MQEKRRLLLLLAALLGVLALGAVAYGLLSGGASPRLSPQGSDESAQGDAPKVIPAPSFSLEDAEGTDLSFSDLLGQGPVVLNFWASTCPPCREEMPEFSRAYEAYGDQIRFVMLNVGDAMRGETREKAKIYLAEGGYAFPVYYDVDHSAVNAYGVRGFPTTVFIDSEGNVAAAAQGMIDGETLATGLAMIAPELFPQEG